MNKKVVLIICIIGLLLLGGGIYLSFNSDKDTETPSEIDVEPTLHFGYDQSNEKQDINLNPNNKTLKGTVSEVNSYYNGEPVPDVTDCDVILTDEEVKMFKKLWNMEEHKYMLHTIIFNYCTGDKVFKNISEADAEFKESYEAMDYDKDGIVTNREYGYSNLKLLSEW